jgi:hypothetical protein
LRYALLQTTLERPGVPQLRRAFRSVRCLTDADADSLASDAYGILVKGLSLADATTLQEALKAEGVLTERVADQDLPAIPPSKTLKRADLTAGAFVAYDPVGRPIPISWSEVTVVAAGAVLLTQFTTERFMMPAPSHRRREDSATEVEPVYRSRERRSPQLLLDLILGRGAFRFHIEGAKFNYNGLGGQKSADLGENFRLFIRALCRHCPRALLNRGAFQVREGGEVCSYPSRNAYHEEILWLLWRRQGAPAA